MCQISDCELMLLKCLWEAPEPLTANQLMDHYNVRYRQTAALSTIYTFLSRLRKKGLVSQKKNGASYYTATLTEKTYLENLADEISALLGPQGTGKFLRIFARQLS